MFSNEDLETLIHKVLSTLSSFLSSEPSDYATRRQLSIEVLQALTHYHNAMWVYDYPTLQPYLLQELNEKSRAFLQDYLRNYTPEVDIVPRKKNYADG